MKALSGSTALPQPQPLLALAAELDPPVLAPCVRLPLELVAEAFVEPLPPPVEEVALTEALVDPEETWPRDPATAPLDEFPVLAPVLAVEPLLAPDEAPLDAAVPGVPPSGSGITQSPVTASQAVLTGSS